MTTAGVFYLAVNTTDLVGGEMPKRALILGVGGQDGSYLADILLERGYEAHGLHRHSSVDNLTRIAHCRGRVNLIRGDVTDAGSMFQCMGAFDEVYHVADQDNVHWSKEAPSYQIDVTLRSVINVFNAVIYENQWGINTKVFVPSSSTIFGDTVEPRTPDSPLDPQTPYAIAKAAVLHLCRYYRREYGLQVYCGVMYGHDSPRRGPDYLLQKIARGEEIGGDLKKRVDIGHASEFMAEAVRWVQNGEPGEKVFRTNNLVTIESLLRWKREGRLDDCYHGNGDYFKFHAAPSVLYDIIQERSKG